MFKTTTRCNQNCAYCYSRVPAHGSNSPPHISLESLETIIPSYLRYVSSSGEASFGWQGGEPTLAGLSFFQAVVAMQKKYASFPMVISNDIQTNGILVDDNWAAFFADYRFLVGLSLDGPEDLHNAVRMGSGGIGSFARAMSAARALRKRDVELNILCVLSEQNVRHSDRVLEFFRTEAFPYVQILPAMNFQATAPFQTADYLVSAPDYGEFLKAAFDIWYGDGYPRFSIRTFDSFLQSYLGLAGGLCIHAGRCDSGLIIDTSGDVYPCDFYLHPRFRLGNISQSSIEELAENKRRIDFINQKETSPASCQSCKWQTICHGGCPRNIGPQGKDILCESYQTLLDHADSRFQELARRMKRRSAFLMARDKKGEQSYSSPKRNDPCPCQSGLKYKRCCGNPALLQSYLFREEP